MLDISRVNCLQKLQVWYLGVETTQNLLHMQNCILDTKVLQIVLGFDIPANEAQVGEAIQLRLWTSHIFVPPEQLVFPLFSLG